ncbi:MAG: hypothetical protein ABH815_05500 [Candidatus Omnitrophota bacterium]
MDKTLRSILWILVALVVLSSFSAGWFFVVKERLFDEYTGLEKLFETTVERFNRELTATNKEKTELKTRFAAVEKELKALESKNKDLEAKYTKLIDERDSFTKELARVKKGKFYLETKLKEMESDNFLAGVLREKIAMEVELTRLKDSLGPRYAEIEKIKAKNMEMEVALSKLIEEKGGLEEKLRDSGNVAEILSRDMLREKDKSEGIRKEAENIKIERNLLKTKLTEIEDTASKFANLVTEKESIQSRLAGLEREIGYRDREIDKLKTALGEQASKARELRAEAYHSQAEVELPPIVLQRQAGDTASTRSGSLERINKETESLGKIVTVNRDHNFVVIDIGKQDGIRAGDVFNVLRGSLFIGTIEVMQTRDRIAAADIKNTKQGFIVEIDDTIVKQ